MFTLFSAIYIHKTMFIYHSKQFFSLNSYSFQNNTPKYFNQRLILEQNNQYFNQPLPLQNDTARYFNKKLPFLPFRYIITMEIYNILTDELMNPIFFLVRSLIHFAQCKISIQFFFPHLPRRLGLPNKLTFSHFNLIHIWRR